MKPAHLFTVNLSVLGFTVTLNDLVMAVMVASCNDEI